MSVEETRNFVRVRKRFAKSFDRLRTITTKTGHRVVIGFKHGKSAVQSVLHPKDDPGLAYHIERHASPSHHVGPCSPECRAGIEEHPHRVREVQVTYR